MPLHSLLLWMTRYDFGYPGDMYYMIFSMVVIECY